MTTFVITIPGTFLHEVTDAERAAWADEVRDPREELDVLPDRQTKATDREIHTAQQLIDALSMEWDPEQFHDTSEERVKALVDAKREGREIVSEAGPPEATNVIDLMEALQRSVEQARSSRGEDEDDEPPGQLHRLPTRNRDGAGKKQPGKKSGAGHRGADDLESRTKTELYELASKGDIPGRSKMNRQQLINALRRRSTAA